MGERIGDKLQVKNIKQKQNIEGTKYLVNYYSNTGIVNTLIKTKDGSGNITGIEISDETLDEKLDSIEDEISGKAPVIHDHDDRYVKLVAGKGLSTNDYTTAEKTKLAGIEAGAQANKIEVVKVNGTTQTITSKTIDITVPAVPPIEVNNGGAESGQYISAIAVDTSNKHKLNITKASLPTKVSQFTNDSNFQTNTQVESSITTHNTSGTSHADIRALINNVSNIANGITRSYVFPTLADLDGWLATPPTYVRQDGVTKEALMIGDNLYIQALDTPDYWWDGTTKQILETQKVDLSDYLKKNVDITGATKTKITYDSKGLVTNGESLSSGDIPALDASKITTGTFDALRIPTLAQSKITNLTTDLGNRVVKNDTIVAGSGTKITYDTKGLVTKGESLSATDVPVLDASKITSGTFDALRIPTLAQSKITNLTTDLADKVKKNADIVGATKAKITYDSKGLVTAGANLAETDIPTLSQSKITNLTTDLGNRVVKNTAITGATKTKITYDSKGLVTSGSDLLATDIPSITKSKISDFPNIRKTINEGSATDLVSQLGIKELLNAEIAVDTNASFTTIGGYDLVLSDGAFYGLFIDQDIYNAPKEIGTRIVLTKQTNQSQNGIYELSSFVPVAGGQQYSGFKKIVLPTVLIKGGTYANRTFKRVDNNYALEPYTYFTTVDSEATDPKFHGDVVFVYS